MKTLDFIYQETQIHFLVNPTDKNVMINATEMAKLFNKRSSDFLRLEGTQNFIKELIDNENSKVDVADVQHQTEEKDVIQTTNKATFFHRKLALKFAAWLDVKFEFWIIDIIDHILFSKTERLSETLLLKEAKKDALAELEEQAYKENNEHSIKMLTLQKEIKKLERLERKENSQLKDQLRIDFKND